MTSPGGREAGRVSVRVLPDTSRFAADLRVFLERIERTMRLDIQTGLDTSGARRDFQALQAVMQRNRVSIGTNLNQSALAGQLAALQAQVRAQSPTVRVGVDRSNVDRLVNTLSGSLGRLMSVAKGITLGPGLALGVGLLGAATVNAVALAGALSQVAAAALLIPAAVGGLAAVGATLLTGLRGVGSAFKELSTPAAGGGAAAAGPTAQQQRAQARQLKAAQDGVADSLERVSDAQKSVAAAQRKALDAQEALNQAYSDAAQYLEDLQVRLSGAAVDQQRAAQDLAEAQQALADARFTGASDLELNGLTVAIAEAQQKVIEAAQSYKDLKSESDKANKAGVAGSDKVLAAQQDVADANDRVVEAEKDLTRARRESLDAQQALADAMADAADSAAAAAAAAGGTESAFAKLAPSAQAFVLAVRALAPEFTALRLAVQENLFQGLGDDFTAMFNGLLPILQTRLAQIASGLNQAASLSLRGILDSAPDIDRLLGNTASATGILAGALASFNDAMLGLSAKGSDYFDRIASAIASASGTFAAWVDRIRSDGSFDQWVGTALSVLGQVGDLLGNLGGIIGGIFSAGADATGGGFLANLTLITGALRDFIKSAEGQDVLASIFTGARDITSALLPVLSALGPVIGAVVAQLGPLAQAIGPALVGAIQTLQPAVEVVVSALGPALQSLAPVLGTVAQALADSLVALAPAIQPAVDAFGAIVTALAPFLPMIAQLIGTLLPPLLGILTSSQPVIIAWAGAITATVVAFKALKAAASIASLIGTVQKGIQAISGATRIWAGVQAALNLVMSANPLVLIGIAIAALVAGIVVAYKESETFRDIVNGAFQAVKDVVTAVVDFLKPYILTAWQVISTVVGTYIDIYKTTIVTAFNIVSGVVQGAVGIFTGAFDAITSALSTLGGMFSSIWSGITSTVSGAISGITGFISGLIGSITDFGSDMLNAGKSLIGKLLEGLGDAAGAVGSVAKAIVNAIIDGLNKIIPHELDIHIPIPAAPDVNITIPLIPNIPHLALGADIPARDGGTLALLSEAGRAERVTDVGLGNENLAANTKLAQAALAALEKTGGGFTQNNTIIQQPGQSGASVANDVARRVRREVRV